MDSKSRWSIANLFKREKPAAPQPTARATQPANPYHAVSIIPGVASCASAHRFAGTRYLSKQAPRLPLPNCDAPECTCRFKHHNDRRAGPRRRADVGFMPGTFNGVERRATRGRRAEDRY
ncbi:MAG TPA: hypothetical protein VFS47_06485 [Steroidobacteraceae bacterium]|nr:hypothetical protein [Steroidobacteraceae bacterium]